jgi:hypothetical protein
VQRWEFKVTLPLALLLLPSFEPLLLLSSEELHLLAFCSQHFLTLRKEDRKKTKL